ncbi:hypothetical protein F5Y00DRAFT_268897 [Daldinia vernicosa]|uniref:uncharacterized protein n=1 Tax=Daldinia vernicosa TaxID=114800 RepID=UPI0020086A5E|nr:uncharacterized protein F5Y00DRAFT_268897 [Daldinia vernicosa]KAI0849801.1 hypothetical protein F5Y00DRAFT_268897 [Daldinia vernicosa]
MSADTNSEMDNYAVMDDIDTLESIKFNLHENLSNDATLQQGGLKSYTANENSSVIYERKKSDHSVKVERLLWVDGWEETIGKGESVVNKQEMTLIVLKFLLASQDPDTRISFMKASILFEDPNKDAKNTGAPGGPEVIAWAPFHSEERWNGTSAELKETTTIEGNFNAGYSNIGVSGKRGYEGEISWARTDFDKGRAIPETNNAGGYNGVTWTLEQNPLQKKGVAQEIWTTVLLSRQSNAPYLVNFNIDVRAGTVQEYKDKTKRFFGFGPGQTKAFLVTPWKKDVCNSEGEDIMQCIDLKNLGRLRQQGKRTKLEVKWGPSYKIETSKPIQVAVDDTTISDMEEKKLGRVVNTAAPPASTVGSPAPSMPNTQSFTLPVTSGPPRTDQSTLPPLLIGWCNQTPTLIADTTRLTALEARLGQIEARLAQQDLLILQLQRALAAKDN